MKKLVLLFLLALFANRSSAQTNAASIPALAETLDQGKMNKKDCVMMVNGKMLMMVNGKTTDMPAEVRLRDGSVVQKNGTVRMKDSTTKVMKNGDSVDMEGNWE